MLGVHVVDVLGSPNTWTADTEAYDAEAFDEYRRFLRRQRRALEEARQLIATGTCCLLCCESDAATCHRHVVADELRQTAGARVTRL